MQRCFHPQNYKITWVHKLETEFCLQNGKMQSPKKDQKLAKPHVFFECGDCGFSAYYAAHNAPHWFPAKMAAVGTGFPNEGETEIAQSKTA